MVPPRVGAQMQILQLVGLCHLSGINTADKRDLIIHSLCLYVCVDYRLCNVRIPLEQSLKAGSYSLNYISKLSKGFN